MEWCRSQPTRITQRCRMAGEGISRVISLWHGVLGFSRPIRLPHPGDYPPNRPRSCLDRRLVLGPERSFVHDLQSCPGRRSPRALLRGLAGRPVWSGADSGRGHLQSCSTRRSAHRPAGNGGGDFPCGLRDHAPRRPAHHEGRNRRQAPSPPTLTSTGAVVPWPMEADS